MLISKMLLILTVVGRTLGDLPAASEAIYRLDTEKVDIELHILEPIFRQDAEEGNLQETIPKPIYRQNAGKEILNPQIFEPIYHRDPEQGNLKPPILEPIYRQDAGDFSAFVLDPIFRQDTVQITDPIYRQRRDAMQVDPIALISEPIYRRDAEHTHLKVPEKNAVDTEAKGRSLDSQQPNIQHETSPYEDAKNAVAFQRREGSLSKQLTTRGRARTTARRRADYDASTSDYDLLQNPYPNNHKTSLHSKIKDRSRQPYDNLNLNKSQYVKDENHPEHLPLYTNPHRERFHNHPSNNKLYHKSPILSSHKDNLLNVNNGDHLPKGVHSIPKFKSNHDKFDSDYDYEYSVDNPVSGSKFGHGERRSGNRVEGSYYVQLPDGNMQRVKYFADHTGYHAELVY